MTPDHAIQWPKLVRHARYRWDEMRRQHQLVFPEGLLVLNETGAAIVRLLDGRSTAELIAALEEQFTESGQVAEDVRTFLQRLAGKGLLQRDANAS